MKPEVEKAWMIALDARHKLRIGQISLEEAKVICQPYINMVNAGAKKMSKEYGNPYKQVSVTSFLR